MQLHRQFQELEQDLLENYHLLGTHSGVPFLLLVYPPDQERICREHQATLMEKLRVRGKPVVEHRLDTFIFDYYSQPRYEKRGGVHHLFELERTDPDGLRSMLNQMYEEELVERICKTANRASPHGAIFITSVAKMYPFGHVSNLLYALENRISIPLVVFYPGTKENDQLSFLGIEPHSGYRAKVIE